jgi:hypothetical protein
VPGAVSDAELGGKGQDVSLLRNDTGHPLVGLGMGNRTMFPARSLFGGGDGTLRVYAIDGQSVHAKGRNEWAPGQRMRIVEAGGWRLRRPQGARASRDRRGRGAGVRQPAGHRGQLRMRG